MTINDAPQETTPAVAPAPAAPKWFAALGLVAGLGAVVASSCCFIPLSLAALGAGAGVLGGLEMVAEWRVPFLAVSALGVVGGWGVWWWKRRLLASPVRPARRRSDRAQRSDCSCAPRSLWRWRRAGATSTRCY